MSRPNEAGLPHQEICCDPAEVSNKEVDSNLHALVPKVNQPYAEVVPYSKARTNAAGADVVVLECEWCVQQSDRALC